MQLDSEISNSMKKFNIFLLNPVKNIIFSTPSEINNKWGTDIQLRRNDNLEIYNSSYLRNILIINSIIFIIIFTLLLLSGFFN